MISQAAGPNIRTPQIQEDAHLAWSHVDYKVHIT